MSQLPYSGTLSVPALTVNTTKPLDVRTVVNSVEDLTNGTIPNLYTGIIVNVKGTKDLYVLTSSPRNAQLEERIALFTDYAKKARIEKRLSVIVEKAEDDIADAINAGVVTNPLPSGIEIVYSHKSFEGLPKYLEGLRSVVKPKTIFSGSLRRLDQSAKQLLEKLDSTSQQLMCLHGKAGMGKTHISCHVAKQLADGRKNNVYLLFGSQFDTATDAWEKMLTLLQLTEDDLKKMNERAADHYHRCVERRSGRFVLEAAVEFACEQDEGL